jgi:hypothetical protein
VVVAVHVLVERGQHVGDLRRPLLGAQDERVDAAQRDLGEYAERTEPDPGRVEHVTLRLGVRADHLAGTGHEREPGDERGQAAQAGTGTVGTGRDRSGDRLHVDVAQVGQGQAERGEQPVQLGQAGTGADRDQPGLPVDGDQPGEPVQVQSGTPGGGGGREGVPRAGRLDRPPVRAGLFDQLNHVVRGDGRDHRSVIPRGSRPVGPFGHAASPVHLAGRRGEAP